MFCQKFNEKEKQIAEDTLRIRIESSNDFWYIGGYGGKDSVITIRCRKCWKDFTRYCDSHFKKSLRSNAAKPLKCPHCIEEAKRQEEETRKRKELSRKHDIEVRRKRQELKTQQRLNEKHICKECGCEYTLASYAEKEHLNVSFVSSTVFCSSECRRKNESRSRRKYNLTHGKHSKRCVKYGVEFDKTVNLEELISKVGTRCALCGGFCDKNDYKVVNGVYLFGDNYPSIDHIIPLSKGVKGHTWDNVQVAHRGCNTRKGSKIVA